LGTIESKMSLERWHALLLLSMGAADAEAGDWPPRGIKRDIGEMMCAHE